MVVIDEIEGRRFGRDEAAACPVCGRTAEPRTFEGRFGMVVSIAECRADRIAWQTPRPKLEASIAYMDWRWSSSDPYVSDGAAQDQRAAAQVRYLDQLGLAGGRLLDFGAGVGTFVRAANDAGWAAEGVEHSPGAVARARKELGVTLTTELQPGEFYDVVTLWDVVEHLRDPEVVLRDLATRLRPGGMMLLETGNYESWPRRARGDAWGLYLLDHQTYFTPHSLGVITGRAGLGGFRLLDTPRVSPHFRKRLWRSIPEWWSYLCARKDWGSHADIDVMVAAVRR